MAERADIVVVGAGFAGLSAARKLREADRHVAVLEARDRVGGRSCNHTLPDGSTVDIGAQWIGPTQERVSTLAKEMGVQTYPTFNEGAIVLEIDGRRLRGFQDIPGELLDDYLKLQAKLDQMAQAVPPDQPWMAEHAAEWDSQTVETWLRSNGVTTGARAVIRIAFRAVFAAEPANLSLLHALFYIRAAGNYDLLTGIEGGAQQDICQGGTQLVAIRLAERLGDIVRLHTPVRRIDHSSNGVRVVSDRGTIEAQHVIVTLPPTLAGRIVYDPPLAADRDQLTQRTPQGSVIKLQLVFECPFWRDDGLSGWTASEEGPVCATMDGSRPNAPQGILVGFLEGDHARRLGRVGLESRRRAVLDHLAQLLGAKAARPAHYVERDWSQEEFTRGCYGAHLPPGVWTQYGPALRGAIGRLHWAGTETARVWAGYLDGAIESGERAAAEVLEARE